MTSFKVENIYASPSISSGFMAKLRQKSDAKLTFVTLSELINGEYEVTIDPSGLTLGSEYILTLESYEPLNKI